MTHASHPDTIIALTIIRNRPEHAPGSAISSIALFEVARAGTRDVRFRIEHAFFDPDQKRAEIIDGLCQRIPLNAELLVAQPRAATHRLRPAAGTSHFSPPSDIELVARGHRDLTILPVIASDANLWAAGTRMGLNMPRRGCTPIRWRRRAPLLAQALWGTYVTVFCSPTEQRLLLAAHQAWCVLQRVRAG